ncbi:cilia- and flagella- associated protein 210-like [Conger conger]|uniref:cilia- and flagella- associated protein 210-like n=1 Tax=Conger conger TaxID=82655 RepID=UPI002A5A530C|nr:cilia- and flagella- associated protein 210-like [Conger conger]
MEMASETTAAENGSRKGLQKQRQEALAKVICQQFYQSDRVKQFHRALLQTEAMKELDDQMTRKQRLLSAAKEETRKFMAEVKREELQSVEQERETARRRERERATYREFLTEQMNEQELRRKRKVEKAEEVIECQKECEQYKREREMLSEQKKEKMMMARKAHTDHLRAMSTARALEAEKLKMEDERRRFFEMERDKVVLRKQEKRAERRRVAKSYKEMVVEQTATELQEKANKEERLSAQILADGQAEREAALQRQRRELQEKRTSMRSAIAAHRESKRSARERQAEEEDRSSRVSLDAEKERDRAAAETQRVAARRQGEKRAAMDDFLRRQIAERRAGDRFLERRQLDSDRKYAELIAEEEEQYQRYTDGVISAARKANRNTFPLLRAAQHGMWSGVGPIYGGMRANYLVPGASYEQMPNYVSTTTKDLKRLYGTEEGQSAMRLSFIW